MVTLGHSSSRLPAHLLSALSLLLHCPGSGGWGQPQRGEDRLPRGPGEEGAGFPGNAGAAHHAPPGGRVPPPLYLPASPGFWQGWARGSWLPLVRVGDPVLTETAGVINCLVSSGYRAKADSSSGMRCGVGPRPEAAENGRLGGWAAAGSVGLTHVDRSLCKCEEVCVQWVWVQGGAQGCWRPAPVSEHQCR